MFRICAVLLLKDVVIGIYVWVQSFLALWTPPYFGHPANMESC